MNAKLDPMLEYHGDGLLTTEIRAIAACDSRTAMNLLIGILHFSIKGLMTAFSIQLLGKRSEII